MKERDFHTGQELTFRPIFKRSDGFAQVQAERGMPKVKSRKRGRGIGGRPEPKACRTAVIQALRFHFYLKVMEIAGMIGVAPQTVSALTVGTDLNVLPWHARRYQREAIEAAASLIEGRAK